MSTQGSAGHKHVCSLHGLGGALRNCCAGTYKQHIVVYPIPDRSARLVAPKASWQAHEGDVTALLPCRYSMQLFTGGAEGSVHVYGPTPCPLLLVPQGNAHSCCLLPCPSLKMIFQLSP